MYPPSGVSQTPVLVHWPAVQTPLTDAQASFLTAETSEHVPHSFSEPAAEGLAHVPTAKQSVGLISSEFGDAQLPAMPGPWRMQSRVSPVCETRRRMQVAGQMRTSGDAGSEDAGNMRTVSQEKPAQITSPEARASHASSHCASVVREVVVLWLTLSVAPVTAERTIREGSWKDPGVRTW